MLFVNGYITLPQKDYFMLNAYLAKQLHFTIIFFSDSETRKCEKHVVSMALVAI